MRPRQLAAAGVLLALISLQPHGAAAGTYVYTPLTVPGSSIVSAYSINDSGQVLGDSIDATNFSTGFIWQLGEYTQFDAPSGRGAYPESINNNGTVVGDFYFSATKSRAFKRKSDGIERKLPIHDEGEELVNALSINDSNQVVGSYYSLDSSNAHGYFYENGVSTDITPPNSMQTFPVGINNLGETAGYYTSSTDYRNHGFTYQNGAYTTFDPPGSYGTFVTSINSKGVITGAFNHSSTSGAEMTSGFVYANGVYTIYDHPGGTGYTYIVAARSSTHFIGYYYVLKGRTYVIRSFNYVDGKEHKIAPPGTTSLQNVQVTGINKQDTIIGIVYDHAVGYAPEQAFVAVCPMGEGECHQ